MDEKVKLTKPPPRVVVQVHGWYPIVMLVMVFVLISVLNVLWTNHVNNERQKEDRRAAAAQAEVNQRAEAAARAASREQSCRLIVAFDDLYRETPPTSPAGVKVAELWADYRRQMAC